MTIAKKILKYIKGTTNFVIFFNNVVMSLSKRVENNKNLGTTCQN